MNSRNIIQEIFSCIKMSIQVLLDDNLTLVYAATQGSTLPTPSTTITNTTASSQLSSQSQYEWIYPNLNTSSSSNNVNSFITVAGDSNSVNNTSAYSTINAGVNGMYFGAVPLQYFNNTDVTTKNIAAILNRANTYQVPKNGTLIIESVVNAKQFNVCMNPFPIELVANPQADPRLVCPMLKNSFTTSGVNGKQVTVNTGFAITNEVIYAFYEILPATTNNVSPNSLLGIGNNAAFTAMIPIAAVNELADDYVTLGIGYNGAGPITWFVNSVEKYIVPMVGFYPEPQYIIINYGGTPSGLPPAGLNVTVGLSINQYMDGCLPGFEARPALIQLQTGVMYYSPYSSQSVFAPQLFSKKQNDVDNVLWGQGGVINLRRQIIYTLNV